jgi:tagatose-6-phosphate ketose/aldose isomerase
VLPRTAWCYGEAAAGTSRLRNLLKDAYSLSIIDHSEVSMDNPTTASQSLIAKASVSATWREINQQPEVWAQTIRTVEELRPQIDAFLAPFLAEPAGRIILTGAGSSAFGGQILAPEITRRLGRRTDAVATTDIVAAPGDYLAENVPTLLISFARSGDSPESVAATQIADELLSDVRHLIVTCSKDGRLFREHSTRKNSLCIVGSELSNDTAFAMTSSLTSMILGTALALFGNAAVNTTALLNACAAALGQTEPIAELALRMPERVFYLGSGPLAGLAREAHLKILELTAGKVAAFYESSMGFRHGPKAALNAHSQVFGLISPEKYTRDYDLDVIAEIRAGHGQQACFTLSGPADDQAGSPGEGTLVLGDLAGCGVVECALAYLVVAQLFALFSSVAHDCTPDNPFPDGDVNRVVKGVTIHPLGDIN